MSTTYTMRMQESQKKLISEYAKMQGVSMADLMIGSTLDVIEDALDLRDWNAAKAEFDADPTTHSNDDIMREFGLR